MECSLTAYEHDELPQAQQVTFTNPNHVLPQETSCVKSVFYTLANFDGSDGEALIFAIRGSSGFLDHVVNLNGELVDVEGFIVRTRSQAFQVVRRLT